MGSCQYFIPIGKSEVFIVFALLEMYMLARGVWRRTLTVDLKRQQITLKAYCPYLFRPQVIPISEVKKVRVSDYTSSEGSGRMYGLVFERCDGSTISFGDWNDKDQKKYERWRDQVTEFAGIDNITRLS